MPFTPYHFGINSIPCLATRNRIDGLALIVPNILIDIEALLVLEYQLDYPLHGYMHTFLLGIPVGIVTGVLLHFLRGLTGPVYEALKLQPSPRFVPLAMCGILGAWLHVAFDMLVYVDMRPFWPINGNPLAETLSYRAATRIGAIGYGIALVLVVVNLLRRSRGNATTTDASSRQAVCPPLGERE